MEILAKLNGGEGHFLPRVSAYICFASCVCLQQVRVETNPDEWPAVAERIAQDNKLCNATYQAKVQFAGPFAASGFA